jgi:uncharacterized protein
LTAHRHCASLGHVIATSTPQTRAADADRLLQKMVDALLATGQPEKIILFGSRARGDDRPDSDLDLLIVQAPQPGGSRWQELRRLRQALRSFPVAKDLLLFRPAEFEYWRDSLNHIVGRAVREGRLLYERP